MISTLPINLVPAPRRVDRKRRKRIKLWVAITCGYSVVLVVVLAVFQAMAGTVAQSIDEELQQVETSIAATNKEIDASAPTLNELRLTLQASQAVGNQPDWSVLLAFVTSRLNDRVVLSGCSLAPIAAAPASAAPARPGTPRPSRNPAGAATPAPTDDGPTGEYRLDVRGMAQTQAALSKFVLALEQAQLFSKVILQDAQRVEFAKGEAIQFQVICTLSGGEASP